MVELDIKRLAHIIEIALLKYDVNDTGDMICDELNRDPNRSDEEIARYVAMCILQP